MRIAFVGHAAILIESGGLRILSDPWWQGPCFGNEWWIYPLPDLTQVEGKIDYIYISHRHADHFHRGTLRRFPRDTKVLVSSTLDLSRALREMGFEVIEVGPDEERALGGDLRSRIIPTENDDTLMAISNGTEVCLNLNDALHAASRSTQDRIIARLKRLYPRIDYVFCGYGIASHFPNCFLIPGKDAVASAIQRQRYFNGQWSSIVARLAPRFAFPFAANVVFLSKQLFWANEPVHNGARPTDGYHTEHPGGATEVIDIGLGFAIADGRIEKDIRFRPIAAADIERVYATEIGKTAVRAQRTADDVDTLKERLEHNIALARRHLLEYHGDYRFLIEMWDRTWAVEIVKSGDEIAVDVVDADVANRNSYDIVFTSYYSYLRRSFSTDYGNETLFVGSGIIVTYRDREACFRNLHRELTPLLARLTEPPRSRFGDQPKWLFQAKRFVKRLLGMTEVDLEDLGTWTRFVPD